jgi:hypothetical protein
MSKRKLRSIALPAWQHGSMHGNMHSRKPCTSRSSQSSASVRVPGRYYEWRAGAAESSCGRINGIGIIRVSKYRPRMGDNHMVCLAQGPWMPSMAMHGSHCVSENGKGV